MRYFYGLLSVAWLLWLSFMIGMDYGDHKAMNRYLDQQLATMRAVP